MCRTLVLGLGNLLRKDDGVGLHIIRKLEERLRVEVRPEVRILDGGTAGIDLLPYLEGIERLIVVDALLAAGRPGEIKVLSEADLPRAGRAVVGHDERIGDVLALAGALGMRPEVTVIGVIPKDCAGFGTDLSPEVGAAVEPAVGLLTRMIRGLEICYDAVGRRGMDQHYRVAIFGSARIREGDKEYRDVYEIARGLAALGFDVVTGGGPGLMQAASAGHQSVLSDSLSIGLNIKLPQEQIANPFLDIKREFDRFSSRLDQFMSLSDAVIVAPGGIGTLLELFYSWQLVQVGHICKTPIILYGDLWRPLLRWLNEEVLRRGFMSPEDMLGVFHLESAAGVVDLIRRIQEDRSRTKDACVNYEKYLVDGTPPA